MHAREAPQPRGLVDRPPPPARSPGVRRTGAESLEGGGGLIELLVAQQVGVDLGGDVGVWAARGGERRRARLAEMPLVTGDPPS